MYQPATTKNVCIFTYSHLAMLISFSMFEDNKKIEELLHQIFKKILVLNPSKDAFSYWIAITTTILEFDQKMEKLWKQEKQAALESMKAAKIMKMTHE
ncbi:HindIII family type II restriction endonuclease [Anabaena sp. FACHB-1237]|uniref:HindIII family type II restriction endonuclease n=1 Tax=Anabaena sp. FACHB-1237 TaxID=2692769 RepID=UPI001680D9C4|nr:HindIII family type II restriction endonuclease [Anabaena sp. FACHB-1237]MBD2138402.1 HindIII family type II restriction endonuclease [Anabaena sp. FACHB-1237]